MQHAPGAQGRDGPRKTQYGDCADKYVGQLIMAQPARPKNAHNTRPVKI